MPKKNDSAVDLHQQLQASLGGAESQVVTAAIAFVEDSKEIELREAVHNLLAIRAGIAAMSKHVVPKDPKDSKQAPKSATGPVPVSKPAVPATAAKA